MGNVYSGNNYFFLINGDDNKKQYYAPDFAWAKNDFTMLTNKANDLEKIIDKNNLSGQPEGKIYILFSNGTDQLYPASDLHKTESINTGYNLDVVGSFTNIGKYDLDFTNVCDYIDDGGTRKTLYVLGKNRNGTFAFNTDKYTEQIALEVSDVTDIEYTATTPVSDVTDIEYTATTPVSEITNITYLENN